MSKEKLCTLIIKDMASAKNITEGLVLNGYSSEIAPRSEGIPKNWHRAFCINDLSYRIFRGIKNYKKLLTNNQVCDIIYSQRENT